MESTRPRRGEIWLAALGAARKGEPGKHRPVIVVSVNEFLVGVDHEFIVVVPLSSSLPFSALRPRVGPETGIDNQSAVITRGIRGVARSRLLQRLGEVDAEKMAEIEHALGLVLTTA
ncbi:MAG TPA: type II toxin-antitoxin system PemK/MazF family toxin [Solirubrobacterales bacterium]|nr:type II toxin-antitoxin system PemK/MazF family toxin [Solirubrobacterales bacterium]